MEERRERERGTFMSAAYASSSPHRKRRSRVDSFSHLNPIPEDLVPMREAACARLDVSFQPREPAMTLATSYSKQGNRCGPPSNTRLL